MLAKSRKYMMGPKQKIQAQAKVGNTSKPHDVGRPSAAPHHMVAAAFGGRHHVVIHYVVRQYFQHLPTPCFWDIGPFLVFSAFACACIFSFRPLLYFGASQGQQPIVLSASLYRTPQFSDSFHKSSVVALGMQEPTHSMCCS